MKVNYFSLQPSRFKIDLLSLNRAYSVLEAKSRELCKLETGESSIYKEKTNKLTITIS